MARSRVKSCLTLTRKLNHISTMSFYLKKSLRFGPLRFNLSKSGIGVSAGVKGFRLGTGPRGNYIHAGRGGIYYRQTLGARRRGGRSANRALQVHESPTRDEIGYID